MAFIATVLAMFMFGAMGLSMVSIVSDNTTGATDDLQVAQSFYVAEAGKQYILMSQLAGDGDFTNNVSPTSAPFGASSIALSPGNIWVEYSNQTKSTIDVKVTAKVGNAVRVIKQSVTSTVAPNQFVSLVGGNISMNNPYYPTNGNIYGNVKATGTVDIAPQVIKHGSVISDPTLVPPTLDFNMYKNMLCANPVPSRNFNSNFTGNVCVNGFVSIGSNVTINGMIYVMGRVNIGNNTTINGSLIAEDTIQSDGASGITFNASTANPVIHYPAVASKADIVFRSGQNMTVRGVLWAKDLDLTLTSNINYTGSFMTTLNMTMWGSTGINLTFDGSYLVGMPGLSGNNINTSWALSKTAWKGY